MSMLVIVTFDLHGANSNEYPRVKAALAKHRLKKEIRSKKSGKLSRLPANTFAAKFSGKWRKKTAKKTSGLSTKRSTEGHENTWPELHNFCRCW